MQKNFRKKKVYASAGLSTSAPADETVRWKMKYFAKQKKIPRHTQWSVEFHNLRLIIERDMWIPASPPGADTARE